jgi:hypothetical protein
MKSYLAAPPNTVEVNRKNVQPYNIPNVGWWVLFSNFENAALIENSDRRYWVHKCCLEVPREKEYYDRLWDFYNKSQGCEKVYGHLMQRDVSAFNPAAPPPFTEAKRDMIAATQPETVRRLREALLGPDGPFSGHTILLAGDVRQAAAAEDRKRVMEDEWHTLSDISDKHLGMALTAAGFVQYRHHEFNHDGKKCRPWVRRTDGELAKLPFDEIRGRYFAENDPADRPKVVDINTRQGRSA